jgi:hypothetical protein
MSFDMSKLIYRKKSALTKEQAQFLIEEHKRLERTSMLESCQHAVTGIDTVSSYQRIALEDNTEAFDIVYKANEDLINEYMDYLDTFKMFHTLIRDVMTYSHMFRVLKYETGATVHPHTDHSPFIYGSATFNLNDDYTGGEFAFWNGTHKVALEAQEAMIWPADFFWVHGVDKVTSGTRYSVNSFLQSIPEHLKQETLKFVDNRIEKAKLVPKEREYNRTHRYKIRSKQ